MKFLLAFLLIGIGAAAQTTVTGTIVDPNGNSYANGTAAAYSVAVSGQPTISVSPVSTNSAGFFTLSLNANTYVFTICAPPVGLGPTQNPTPTQICFPSNPIAISGPSQDVSAQLNALAKVIGPNRNITSNAVSPVSRASIQAGATSDVQISNAITALAGGSGTIWADYSTIQAWSACPTWGSGNVNLVLYAVTFNVAVSCTIPKNVTIQHVLGSLLTPATGTVLTYLAYPDAGSYPIFGNALNGQGAIDFNGNTYAFAVHPEWWGASPSASATLNTSAVQAAEYAAFGCNTSPVTSCHTNVSGLTQYNKPLEFCSKLTINGEITFYHVISFIIRGCGKQNSGLVQSVSNKRIIDGQNIAYGTIHDLLFNDTANNTGPLVDLDNDGTHGADLSPQNITFHDVFFSGNGSDDVGVLVSKTGGSAQGDNIRCYNCYFLSFSGAGWQVGGDNTGRNAGRQFAQNAIKQLIKGGDMQGNPLYGVAVYGGSIEVDGTTMENDSVGFGTQTGFDMLCSAPQDRCVMRNVRSESHKLASGVGLIEHSRTLFQPGSWYSASRFTSYAGTVVNGPTYFSGTGQGGDGKYYVTTSTGTFGGLGLTTATSGSATTLVNSGASYTTNVFVGQQATIIAGTGNGCYGVITANNSTTITFGAGLVTNYYQLACSTPDNTSQFVVEPNWSANPTSSGTVSFALFDFQVIGACAAGGSTQGNMGNCLIDDVAAPGGTSNLGGQLNRVKNFFPSRTDFLGTGFPLEDSVISNIWQNVEIERPDSAISVSGTGKLLNWTFNRNSGGNSFFIGPLFTNMGTQPFCWSYGQNGGGSSANDVCIGVRTDNNSTNSVGRAVLGILGTVGPITPFGTNQAGKDLPVSGGLSTGNGAFGGISFRLGTVGASGTQVNDSSEVARIDANGYKLPQFTFANLPLAPNGYTCFCTDCNSTCTAGSSTGRTCFRENGAWTH